MIPVAGKRFESLPARVSSTHSTSISRKCDSPLASVYRLWMRMVAPLTPLFTPTRLDNLSEERIHRTEGDMTTRSYLRWLLVIVLAMPVAAPAPGLAQGPIRIGASISATGSYAKHGSYGREGYLRCQRQVKEQGGLLGRKIELVIYDDRSDPQTAVRLYEKLITEDKVDAVMGPYASNLTEAVANVTEKYQKLLVAPLAATTSIWEKGRKYLIMVVSPSEVYLEGLVDLAARNGLKTIALINEDTLFPKAAVKGAVELAKKKGMEVVFGASQWEPGLPYPGIKEFVEGYKKEFNRVPSYHSAAAYAGCQLFAGAVRRVGILDADKLRQDLLKLKTRTAFVEYRVDERGFQTGHKMVTIQWQEGKQIVVWPDEVSSGKPQFPTPLWTQR